MLNCHVLAANKCLYQVLFVITSNQTQQKVSSFSILPQVALECVYLCLYLSVCLCKGLHVFVYVNVWVFLFACVRSSVA